MEIQTNGREIFKIHNFAITVWVLQTKVYTVTLIPYDDGIWAIDEDIEMKAAPTNELQKYCLDRLIKRY